LAFVFLFKDTFRRERSLTYQSVLKRVRKEREQRWLADASHRSSQHTLGTVRAEPDTPLPVAGTADPEKADAVAAGTAPPVGDVKLSITEVNPFPPLWHILRRLNNLVTLTGSGLLFAFTYFISYTSTRTLGSKYHYNALEIGYVLFSRYSSHYRSSITCMPDLFY
jgi:hypothetical protein